MTLPIDLRFLDPASNPALSTRDLRAIRQAEAPQPRQRDFIDRLLGIGEAVGAFGDRDAARSAGLLRAGTTLLQASGPSRTPIGLGQAIGAAVEQGQTAAGDSLARDRTTGIDELQFGQMLQDLTRRDALQTILAGTAGAPVEERVEALTSAGFLDEADTVAQTADRVRPDPGSVSQVDRRDSIELIDESGATIRVIPKAPDTEKMGEIERQLTNDFTGSLDRLGLRAMVMQVGQSLTSRDRALDGDGAAQIEMLYSFITAMDPRSTVRESEVALIESVTPIIDQAKVLLERHINGETVTVVPQLINQMADAMQRRLDMAGETWESIREPFVTRAIRQGITDPVGLQTFESFVPKGASVTRDPFSGPPPGN